MNKIDESKCPLCGEVNLCAEVVKQLDAAGHDDKPCWCHNVNFPPKVLDAVPTQAKNKACICQQCVTKLALTHSV